jgi:hypothetical protein
MCTAYYHLNIRLCTPLEQKVSRPADIMKKYINGEKTSVAGNVCCAHAHLHELLLKQDLYQLLQDGKQACTAQAEK